MTTDPIRDYLRSHGGSHLVDGGLPGLLGRWARTAFKVEANGTWYWEEWVNDLDTRQLLSDLVEAVPEAHRVQVELDAADETFRTFAISTSECAWYDDIAEQEGWTPARNWWYWTKPPTPYRRAPGDPEPSGITPQRRGKPRSSRPLS